MKRSAVISSCGVYRYLLTREWSPSLPRVSFIMLNPSTADGSEDDPTIRKCVGFAELLGFGSLEVTNLFAFRATDPKDLKAKGYWVGPENNTHIRKSVQACNTVICAWGANARGMVRPVIVAEIIKAAGKTPLALKLLSDGMPAHPLYLPYTCKPKEML